MGEKKKRIMIGRVSYTLGFVPGMKQCLITRVFSEPRNQVNGSARK